MRSTIELSTLKDPNEQRNTDTTACYLKLIINICPREKGPTAYFKILHRRSDFHQCATLIACFIKTAPAYVKCPMFTLKIITYLEHLKLPNYTTSDHMHPSMTLYCLKGKIYNINIEFEHYF